MRPVRSTACCVKGLRFAAESCGAGRRADSQLACPESGEFKLDFPERFGADDGVGGEHINHEITRAFEPKNFECFARGLNDPNIRHAVGGVEGKFPGTVELFCRWRRNLTQPIRAYREESLVGECWKVFATPSGEIRHDNIVRQMHLRLDQEYPASRSPAPLIKGRTQATGQACGGSRVPDTRTW